MTYFLVFTNYASLKKQLKKQHQNCEKVKKLLFTLKLIYIVGQCLQVELFIKNNNLKCNFQMRPWESLHTWGPTAPAIMDKNIGTNDKFYRKVAFLIYMEMFNFRPQSRKAASKPKPHLELGTRLPSSW